MTIRANSIRLFVSSTFSDFYREREILDAEVFPQIRDYCSIRGYEFLPVDLRWGISEAESRSQQTLRICLNEVTRCVQTSLRPYFLVLTGDRYGWQPLPSAVSRPEFERLCAYVAQRETEKEPLFEGMTSALSQWYRVDLNQVPPQYLLQSREDIAPISLEPWNKTEQRLRTVLRAAAAGIGLRERTGRKHFLSATAQEIWHGVLAKPKERGDFKEHVLCFHRRRLGTPPSRPLPLDPAFTDVDAAGAPDSEAGALLAKLQRRLRTALGDNVLVYQWFPDSHREATDYERAFKGDATRLLMSLVKGELDRLEQFRKDEQEWRRHDEFGRSRSNFVLGRRSLVSKLDRFLDRRDGRGLIVHGPGGIGKSTLMAKAAAMALDPNPMLVPPRGLVTIQRFIGTTADSSVGHSLISGLVQELAAGTGLDWEPSTDVRTLGNELRRLLSHAAQRTARGIVMVLDGLDQLHPDDPARNFEWLPWPAPPHVGLIVSVTGDKLLAVVKHRMSGAEDLAVKGLAETAGRGVLRSLLRESDRQLQPEQLQFVLDHFREEASPLYLRIVANMAKKWPAYRDEKPFTESLPRSTTQLISQYFDNLARQGHGRLMVSKAVGLLVASRQGLTEQELLSLLWKDRTLRESVEASRKDSQALASLPMILWSRLRDDLEPYLVERVADGTTVLAFFHRVFDEAARDTFLATPQARLEMHRALAEHFRSDKPWTFDPVGEARARPKRRTLAELPYQLIAMGDGHALYELLLDADYREAKLDAGMADEMYGEFHACDRLLGGSGDVQGRAGLIALLTQHVAETMTSLRPGHVTLFVETLHTAFAHKNDASFYTAFLETCIAELRTSGTGRARVSAQVAACLEARLANLRRRAFSLEDAQTMLNIVLPQLRRMRLGVEASRVEYDHAYVAFLRGDLDQAGIEFRRSATTARKAQNAVSEWISLCLAANVRWIAMVSRRQHGAEAPRFLAVLDEAEPVFRNHVTLDVNAARWIFNVRVHRFRTAFRIGDLALARRMRDEIREDAWARQYELRSIEDIVMDARLLMLERRFEPAADTMLEVARELADRVEAVSEYYFDAGFAYWEANRTERALEVWEEGLSLRAERGNRPWQRLIDEAKTQRLS
jgi:hypothetical protein